MISGRLWYGCYMLPDTNLSPHATGIYNILFWHFILPSFDFFPLTLCCFFLTDILNDRYPLTLLPTTAINLAGHSLALKEGIINHFDINIVVLLLSINFITIQYNQSTHCGLVTPYGIRHLVQHWLRESMTWCLMTPSHYLNQCWLIIHQRCSLAFTWEQFHKKCS